MKCTTTPAVSWFRIAARLPALVALGLYLVSAHAAPINLLGGTDAAPTDITVYLLANQDLNFTGGTFVARLPQTGAGLTTPGLVDGYVIRYNNNGFASPTNPTINYTGQISGDGTLIVRSGFNPQRPTGNTAFSGGALIFTHLNGQTWGVSGVASLGHNVPALKIETNAMVEFFAPDVAPVSSAFPASTMTSRNILNDGYLYSSHANAWGSITGTGVNVFQFRGGNDSSLSPGGFYSGRIIDLNSGLRVLKGAVFENQPTGDATLINSTDISVWNSNGVSAQFLTDSTTYKPGDPVWTLTPDIHMYGLDVQPWGTGIINFTGVMVPPLADSSKLDPAPFSEAVKGMYFALGQGFGRRFYYSNRPTILMGDGRDIVTNADGVTTNVFLQGNPWNSLLSINGFEKAAQANRDRFGALALNYNGTYRVNFNMNADGTGGRVITGPHGTGDWQNFIIMDPTVSNPKAKQPNHPVVTTTVFFAGLTRIDKNATLELGDGTVGNNAPRTLTINGKTITSDWSDSSGNGMLMTQGNQALLGDAVVTTNKGVNFEIANNGQLVVNNTPGAADAVASGANAGASVAVAAWVSANELDGITGTGSVEQKGNLPLTLGSAGGKPNTYSGGTRVSAGATVIAGGTTALGARDVNAASASGRVINNGTLKAAPGVRVINVPGDYVQVTSP